MKLKTLQSIDIKNKIVLYRAPYDIGTIFVNGKYQLEDDMRIRATLPTLEYLIKENCKIIILTYVGRPDGQVVESLRVTPHAEKLSELLKREVITSEDCVGDAVDERIKIMKAGEILMLENVRFHKEEMSDDDEFAKKLCLGKDVVVFDGFPQAHRMHSSTTGIMRHLPSVAGFYLEKEIDMLSSLLDNQAHPFAVIIGGAKISDKVDAVNNLLKIADKVLIGGASANVFLKACGYELGSSFIEDVFVDTKRREKKDWVEYAKEIMHQYKDKLVLPADVVVSDGVNIKNLDIAQEGVKNGWSALDIGMETQKNFSEIIKNSKLVFLAGPMGKYEDERFADGSEVVLHSMENLKNIGGIAIIAGGDTIDMARRYGNLDNYSYASLAGGATLEFLAGKTLPALVPLIIN